MTLRQEVKKEFIRSGSIKIDVSESSEEVNEEEKIKSGREEREVK